MAYHGQGAVALDYFPCRYGGSGLVFRGPRRRLEDGYVVALGGAETYGRFIERPWPDILEKRLGVPVANLGLPQGGLDAWLGDPAVRGMLAQARHVVVQATGAHLLSNRYYRVHPRRCDRLVATGAEVEALCPGLDLTRIAFVRHFLSVLGAEAPEAVAAIARETGRLWCERMEEVAGLAGGRATLLWLSDRAPPDGSDASGSGSEPLFVTRPMLEAVRPKFRAVVELVHPAAAGMQGKIFAPGEEPMAGALPGPEVHERAADLVEPLLRPRH